MCPSHSSLSRLTVNFPGQNNGRARRAGRKKRKKKKKCAKKRNEEALSGGSSPWKGAGREGRPQNCARGRRRASEPESNTGVSRPLFPCDGCAVLSCMITPSAKARGKQVLRGHVRESSFLCVVCCALCVVRVVPPKEKQRREQQTRTRRSQSPKCEEREGGEPGKRCCVCVNKTWK